MLKYLELGSVLKFQPLLFVTGYILSVVLLTLPRQHLVRLYLYFLTALLLYAGHQISR